MPKTHSDFPINFVCRISVRQRDYLDTVADMHGVSPSGYVRALIDAALAAEAKAHIGLPGVDDATALARAHQIAEGDSHA